MKKLTRRRYSAEELDKIIAHAHTHPYKETAEKFGRTLPAITSIMRRFAAKNRPAAIKATKVVTTPRTNLVDELLSELKTRQQHEYNRVAEMLRSHFS